MDVNGASALSVFAYRTTLSRSGDASLALQQALTTSQSQVSEVASLLTGATGSTAQDPLYAQSVGSQNLSALTALGVTNPSRLAPSDGLPLSAALLAPSAAAALVRYAYDQSQAPQTATQMAQASVQQARLTTGLDLLA